MLRSRDFRLLLVGQTTSQLGAQVSGVAIPLLAVFTLDATALQVGLVNAAGTIAFAVIGLPAGAWVDRMRRRPVLVAADAVRALLLATLPVAAWLGWLSIGQLIVVALLSGFGRVFFDVAYQSYLPTVTGRDGLLSGNSAMETVRAGGQIVGPVLGGGLVTLVGAVNVVLVQAVTFAVSAVSLVAIRTHEAEPVPTRTRLRADVAEGLRFVVRTPLLRATAVSSTMGNFAFGIGSAVGFLFMVRELGLSGLGVGILLAVGSLTVMAGAALTPRLARRFGSARIVWLSLALSGPVALLGPLATPGVGVVLLVLGTAGQELGQIVYAITNVSLRQRLCPPQLLGRVTATMRVLMMGPFPLGALIGGVLGDTVGLRFALLVSCAIVAASAVPAYRALRGVRDTDELREWQPVQTTDR